MIQQQQVGEGLVQSRGRGAGGVPAWELGSCASHVLSWSGQPQWVCRAALASTLLALILWSFVSFSGHSSSFHAGMCGQPRLVLCAPSACSLSPLTQPDPQSNTAMLGLQEMCWLCSSGCSLLSQHWPSCCTSISTAARTHGEQWGDTRGQCLGAGWVQSMRTGFNAGFRQQDPLPGVTVPLLSFPTRLDSPTKSKVIYTAASTENTA